ncbi:MAG: hypothetical protein IJF11_01340 [Clostridia bacterium]|nr:hypothetical protein [Clostridia bacterium]
MELLYLVGTIWALLFLTFAFCFDDRRPMSTKLKYKYRVKENSIFRKIIKFKDKKHYPCNYFKIVPFYVFLLLAVLSLILLFVDIFTNGFITNTIPEEAFIIAMLCIFVISIAYFLVIIIWWEIVDYNEFKFAKEELYKERKNKK